ncbi:MAG: hypothetical protein AAB426_12885, partial [Myxococcota bacterium]
MMLALLTGLGTLAVSAPTACERLDLRATIASGLDVLEGELVCHGPSQAFTALTSYPRLLRTPGDLDDRNWHWFYPHGFDPGDMQVSLDGTALERDSAIQDVTPRDRAARIRFVTHVPRRNGLLGRARGVLYALGGWAPLPLRGDELDDADVSYDITVPEGAVGFVGTQPFGRTAPRRLRGTWHGNDLPLLVASQASVRVHAFAVIVQPEAKAQGGELRPLLAGLDRSRLAQLEQTLRDGAAFAATVGLDGPPPIVVSAPLRENLVEPFDGGFVVSDRLFAVVPWEVVRRLHRRSVWQAQLTHAALAIATRRQERLAPRLVAEAVAAGMVTQLLEARYGTVTEVTALLAPLAVIPEVEALLFAPQVPFVNTYFQPVDTMRRGRRRIDNFFHARPDGALVHARLTHLIGKDEAMAMAEA